MMEKQYENQIKWLNVSQEDDEDIEMESKKELAKLQRIEINGIK